MAGVAEKAQEQRDLKRQLEELDEYGPDEVEFRDISPGRERVTIWSLVDGEPVKVPKYMLPQAMAKRLPDGSDMFTGNRAEAPEYKIGNVKCFLHPESPEREILDEIGLAGITCGKATLASNYSKRWHGRHRHHDEWEAHEEEVARREKLASEARQQEQTDAMLAMAGSRAPKKKEAS